jgi:hypothetical protein
MRVGWSAEVSLLVVALYTMRQAFALEILTQFTEPSASSRVHQRVHSG